MTAVALLAGVALGWALKDGAVWQLAEAVRYLRGELAAAERDIRDQGRGRVPFEHLRARRRGTPPPAVARSWVVRVSTRQRKPWRPAPWPGWGT